MDYTSDSKKGKFKIYEVGGAVRDKLLGLIPKDIDYAIETETFDSLRQGIIDRGGKIFLETPQYLTIRAKMPELGAADFVLCRRDGEYSDGRHPDDVQPGTIFDDLARRDFTVNAMAHDIETHELLDPHNGKTDLGNHVLRFVGNPNKRLAEDKLRAFRAVRFEVTKDLFINVDASAAIRALTIQDFENVSTERIREELTRMFAKDFEYSFHLIFQTYQVLGAVVKRRGIWFKPTTESR